MESMHAYENMSAEEIAYRGRWQLRKNFLMKWGMALVLPVFVVVLLVLTLRKAGLL